MGKENVEIRIIMNFRGRLEIDIIENKTEGHT